MKTEILHNPGGAKLEKAARIIREGGLVAFPTETVYGLGANALLADAAKKVYAVKGRPSDNPLIIHLCDPRDAEKYCFTSELYYSLAASFMPGPLTLILPKREIVPDQTTGGLDTVAVRVPAHPMARELIRRAGVPVAAPSANLSGRPSCTTFAHVLEDMNGRIDMILDGGDCEIGLESTILSIAGGKITLLRPGGITKEMLEAAGFSLSVDKAVTQKLSGSERPMAPGMKYRHYAPKADLILLDGTHGAVEAFMRAQLGKPDVALIAYPEYRSLAGRDNVVLLGSTDDPSGQGHVLFDLLRGFDSRPEIKQIYAKLPDSRDLGLAIYNRMLKAAGYHIQKV